MVVPLGIKFPLVHTTVLVGPGQSADVYDLPIPKDWVAFIELFGNVYYEDSYYTWVVDGKQVMGKIDFEVGEVNRPKVFDPPIIVKKRILVRAYNTSATKTRRFHVVMDGTMYPDVVTVDEVQKTVTAALEKLTPEEVEAIRAKIGAGV